MAITNAQQYQQLVRKDANGKRPGYRGDAAYRSYSASSTGSQRGAATKSELGGGKPGRDKSLRDDPKTKQVYKDSRDDEIFKKRRELKKEVQKQEEEKAEEKVERFRNKQLNIPQGIPYLSPTLNILKKPFQAGMTRTRRINGQIYV